MMRSSRWVACVLVVVACGVGAAEEEEAATPLRFLRVHVPHGKLPEVDLWKERYVPMTAAEFTAGVARLLGDHQGPGGSMGLDTLVETARYDATMNRDPQTDGTSGRAVLTGTATWTIREVGPMRSLDVGGLRVDRAWMQTAAGTGDALVFGRTDGTLGIDAPQAGVYGCEWRCDTTDAVDGGVVFRMPLVAALSSAIHLRLPAAVRPIVAGAEAVAVDAASSSSAETTWRIDVGPRRAVDIAIVPRRADDERGFPRARVWNGAHVRGREVSLRAVVEPIAAWRPTDDAVGGCRLDVTVPAEAVVTDVRFLDADDDGGSTAEWRRSPDGSGIVVDVPTALMGTRAAIVVEAVAPWDWGRSAELPLVKIPRRAWAGGGVVLGVDPALAISRIDTEGCAAVTPDVAARWPAALVHPVAESAADVRAALVYVEHQQARHAVRIAVEPRVAEVDVGRVTVVDVSPGAVLGRARCDFSVPRGEAFEIRGRLAKGWVLDAVEAGDEIDAAPEAVDWRVIRAGGHDEVRIALSAAVSPGRSLTLRLTGHRAGIPPGIDMTSDELDMVRFAGENQPAVLAVKTGPEMTIDLVGEEPPVVATDSVQAALVADSSIRVRLAVGDRFPERTMRLVRRRPPVDVRTEVRITSRDGRMSESFTFECTPQRTDLDAVVVHFSTVMDDRLEWSLLPPASGTLVARRIEPPDRREARTGEPIADSWIVELSPSVRDTVTIRASCTMPFSGPTPVPLAWVEGSVREAGVVSIREAGRFRPRIVNRRLEELPPAAVAGEQTLTTVGEFSFDPGRGRADDPLPAAEIVPGGDGGGTDGRAWAWREENTIWCHASGEIEFETTFKLHNHGRAAVTVSVPSARQLQGVLVDGAVVAGQSDSAIGGAVTVELPVGKRFVDLVVRCVATHDARRGMWWIDPQGVAVDVPVLLRTSRMLLAPDVAIARTTGGYRVVDDAASAAGWSRRLLAAAVRPAAVAATPPPAAMTAVEDGGGITPSGSIMEGYRPRAIVPVIGSRGSGMLLVRTAVVESAAILAAALVFAGVLLVPSGLAWLVPCLCGVAAVGALWVAVPFDAVFRAAGWASVAAAVLRLSGLCVRPAAVAAVMAVMTAAAARADEPLRVYLTPLTADPAADQTVLVPEQLFRALSRATVEPARVRVVSSAVVARMSAGPAAVRTGAWRLTVDIDADAGTTLVLDQADSGATVAGTHADVDGEPQAMQLEDQGRKARIAIPTAGRHRIDVAIRPGVARRGDVEEAVARIPTAAIGRLTLATGEDAAAIVCEAAMSDGPFLPMPTALADAGGQPTFDVSRMAAVRLCRAVDPRLRLASAVRAATSRNDVFWDLDACRVVATFEVDGGNEVVRSAVIAVDSDLQPLESRVPVRAIAPHRYLVERETPVRGRWTVQVPFRTRMADPVGVFAVPGAWIENVVADERTTLFVPAPDLAVEATLPDGMTAAPREADASLQGFAWRQDVTPASARGGERPVVTIERRASRPRATQQLAIDFEPDQVRLDLLARIDASATPLVEVPVDVPADAVVDRVVLVEDRGFPSDAGDRGPVDIRWSRTKADAVLVVMQRPRSGRFRLEIEARLTKRPAARGSFSLMRAGLAGSGPMVVDWKSADGRSALIRATDDVRDLSPPPAGERAVMGSIDVADGQAALAYDLVDAETPASPPAAAGGEAMPTAEQNPRNGRVEWSEILWHMDGRGWAWGCARFEVVAADSAVRLALPTGMRMFEVLVDGRAVEPLPDDEGAWTIPLFGTRWPRTVHVVFAGESGAADIDGTPFAVSPPRVVDLPCRAVAWTIHVAPGLSVRVADPLRTVDQEAVDAARRAVAERLEDEFIRAIEDGGAAERSRMTDFARLRRGGAALPSEEAWARAIASGPAPGNVLHVLVPEPGADGRNAALVLRIGRAADPTAPPRALVTLGIVAACAGAWNIAARWPRAWRRSAARLLPAALGIAAAVWLSILTPVWPGWLLAAVAAAVAAVLWRRGGSTTGETSVAQSAPSATVSLRAEPSTPTFYPSAR